MKKNSLPDNVAYVSRHLRMTVLLCVVILACSFTQYSLAQQGNNWYFARRAAITFNTNPPSALADSKMSTNEGCSTISDSNGRLLFYTNGDTVWNRMHQVMANGTDLKGHFSSSNSAIIIPRPGSSTIYYIFTAGEVATINSGYHYSEVDMSLDGGMGAVTANKNILLYTRATEKLTAARHSNGTDVWIITRVQGNAEWRAFKVDCHGVNTTPVVSISDNPLKDQLRPANTGCMKVSPDGTKVAVADAIIDTWELWKFDPATGNFSNNLFFPSEQAPYGVEFSPDSKLLYVSNAFTPGVLSGNLVQYNVTNHDSIAIAASKFSLGQTTGPSGAIQLGPDNKIYCSVGWVSFLGVINNPNVQGAGCGFNGHQLDLANGTSTFFGLTAYFTLPAIQANAGISYNFQNDCATVDFTGSTSFTGNVAWRWDFGDGIKDSVQNTSHVYAPGQYTVKLLVQSGSCEATSSKDLQLGPPHAFAGNDTTIATGQPVQLHASGGVHYKWTPSDFLSSDTVFNPVAILTKDQKYTVKVTSAEGCSAEDDVVVHVFKGPDIYVPNAFSPTRRNNVFRPVLVGVGELQYFTVYNRWGQLVFTTREPGAGWDGRINGVLQPGGIFAWTVMAKDYAGRSITKTGTVLLVR